MRFNFFVTIHDTVGHIGTDELGQFLPHDEELRLLRIDRVLDLVPIGRSSLYRYVEEGSFPAPIKQGGVSLWVNTEIQAWLRDRLAARRSNEDLI